MIVRNSTEIQNLMDFMFFLLPSQGALQSQSEAHGKERCSLAALW